MKKARIAIASVLKPLTEPRAFGKLAISLRETNKYHLNIIGFCSKIFPKGQGIRFCCIFKQHRTHFTRVFVPFKFLWEIFRYRPSLLIVTTYELLPMAVLGKFFLKYPLIYDVQENYHLNVLLNNSRSAVIKHALAFFIKAVEKTAHPFIDHYFFAERSYPSEFPYIQDYTILENKYNFPIKPPKQRIALMHTSKPKFIITGTITPVYGIENAIKWFLKLKEIFPEASLKITGHVPQKKFKKHLENCYGNEPRLQLNFTGLPLPYSLILQDILDADIILMPYEIPDSIKNKIPSKLYEAIALKKPILITRNPLWKKILDTYPAGLSIDFSGYIDAGNHFEHLLTLALYEKGPGLEVSWESEKPKLLGIINQLLR